MGSSYFPGWMGETPRVGAPWTDAEESVLIADFRAGASLEEQCAKHGRAPGGINSRLMQLLGRNHYVAEPPISQVQRDTLVAETKRLRQLLTSAASDLATLTAKIYDMAKGG